MVDPLLGDSSVDVEHADGIVLFGEGADKLQSSDRLKQQYKDIWDAILFLKV